MNAAPPLFYTAGDSALAHKNWKANCGPHSIAAILGKSLEQIRPSLADDFKGWMNPTGVQRTLLRMGVAFTLTRGLKTHELCNGINRVQFEGPWLKPGAPARAAYVNTHWVAHRDGWVLCTALCPFRWVRVDSWRVALADPDPFHITHHYEVAAQ